MCLWYTRRATYFGKFSYVVFCFPKPTNLSVFSFYSVSRRHSVTHNCRQPVICFYLMQIMETRHVIRDESRWSVKRRNEEERKDWSTREKRTEDVNVQLTCPGRPLSQSDVCGDPEPSPDLDCETERICGLRKRKQHCYRQIQTRRAKTLDERPEWKVYQSGMKTNNESRGKRLFNLRLERLERGAGKNTWDMSVEEKTWRARKERRNDKGEQWRKDEMRKIDIIQK